MSDYEEVECRCARMQNVLANNSGGLFGLASGIMNEC